MRRTAARLLPLLPLFALAALLPVGVAPTASAQAPPTRSVTVGGTGVSSYPAFTADVTRYGVRTTAATGGSITVTASTSDPDGTVTVDGRPAPVGQPVALDGLADGDEVAVRISDAGGTTSYGLIVLPAGFPLMTATSTGEGPSDGLVFLTLGSFFTEVPPFITAVDDQGVPAVVVATAGNDFKAQPDGRYSVAATTSTPGRTGERIAALDPTFQQVAQYETVGLVNTDFHDSILLPNGNVLLMAYEPDEHPDFVLDAMIQEQTADGTVVFEWDSEDHIPESDALLGASFGDYAHINSLDVMDDGDILASFRNTSQVLRIARTAHDGFQPGDVVWRLGGVSSDFTFVDDPEAGFCAQHTARQLDNGNILLFDNGAAYAEGPFAAQTGDVCPDPDGPGERRARPFSRVVEYELDEDAMTATLVWSYTDGTYTPFAGSSQRLADGHTMIGWVNDSPIASEVDAEGDEVWSLSTTGYNSYRAQRFALPDAVAPEVAVTAPADGATFVRNQVVNAAYGCTDRGGSTLQTCVGPASPGSAIDTSTPGEHTFTVTATDGDGNTTEVTRSYTVEVGEHQPDGFVRRKARGPFKGNGVYDDDGAGQTVLINGRRGRTVTGLLRFQNDGAGDDSFTIRGSANTPEFQVRYFRGARDITAEVKAGAYATPNLEPGRFHPIRVEIRVKPVATPGARHRVRITATSVADPARSDTVVVTARATG